MFVLCILAVFSVIQPLILLFIVLACLLPTERNLFFKIDYALLFTFVGFFIFVGNINEIPQVKEFFLKIISGREMTSALLLSQCISNVPAAILLSKFTENYTAMIVGTNIGGLGTVVASLASLISFRFYIRSDGAEVGKYLSVFTAVNLAALILLYLFSTFYYGF
ncbi:hypothetical protein SDC9_200205 [bioreactor metagenome]|uniref:Inner membrane protein YbiR n=1 Tax=bioreactor metagenome TaxID=1076179 RepID=A0A645IZB2_9ZZZZ